MRNECAGVTPVVRALFALSPRAGEVGVYIHIIAKFVPVVVDSTVTTAATLGSFKSLPYARLQQERIPSRHHSAPSQQIMKPMIHVALILFFVSTTASAAAAAAATVGSRVLLLPLLLLPLLLLLLPLLLPLLQRLQYLCSIPCVDAHAAPSNKLCVSIAAAAATASAAAVFVRTQRIYWRDCMVAHCAVHSPPK
jgi:hypothetical protein